MLTPGFVPKFQYEVYFNFGLSLSPSIYLQAKPIYMKALRFIEHHMSPPNAATILKCRDTC